MFAGVSAFDPAAAAHAAVGTRVADLELPLLAGGRANVLGDAQASVLVFLRAGQDRSAAALRELARCQHDFAGKPVRWAVIVSDSESAERVAVAMRDSRFDAPLFVDGGDVLYASLGISLHPVTVVVGRDRTLAAFEPFRSLDYCPIVRARIRHALGEISDAELGAALDPPRAVEGGDAQAARRYRALAELLFKAGNHDKALESARKSLERDPNAVGAHALIGQILLTQSRCDEAVAAFGRALLLDPTNQPAREGIERCRQPR